MKVLLLFTILGCAAAFQPLFPNVPIRQKKQAPRTIVDVLIDENQDTALQFLEATGLLDELQGEGPFTVFLPSQAVFEALPQEMIDELLADLDYARKGLQYHIALGRFGSGDLANELLLPTLEGSELRVNEYDVEGSKVFSVAGVPIDLENVDIEAGNGLIHYIEFIILDVPDYDMVDTLLNTPAEIATFNTFYYAAQAAAVLDVALNTQDYTMLAPVDSDAWSPELVDDMIAADSNAFRSIMGDHIVIGTQFSVGMALKKEVQTLSGNTLVVGFSSENGFFVEDLNGNLVSDIMYGDIPTYQGVVHFIDRPIIL